MAGHADRHGVETRARQIADGRHVLDRRDDGQRSGPELTGQVTGALVEVGDPFGGLQIGDVGDQRVEARPALGLEDRRHGGRIGRVRAQAIDGLGRQDDQPARAQGAGGRLYFRLAVSEKLTFTLAAI